MKKNSIILVICILFTLVGCGEVETKSLEDYKNEAIVMEAHNNYVAMYHEFWEEAPTCEVFYNEEGNQIFKVNDPMIKTIDDLKTETEKVCTTKYAETNLYNSGFFDRWYMEDDILYYTPADAVGDVTGVVAVEDVIVTEETITAVLVLNCMFVSGEYGYEIGERTIEIKKIGNKWKINSYGEMSEKEIK